MAAQLAERAPLRDPKNYIDDRRMQLDYTQRRLIAALQRLVAQQREALCPADVEARRDEPAEGPLARLFYDI